MRTASLEGRKRLYLAPILSVTHFFFFLKVHSFIQGFICSVVTKWPGPFCIEFACSVGAVSPVIKWLPVRVFLVTLNGIKRKKKDG